MPISAIVMTLLLTLFLTSFAIIIKPRLQLLIQAKPEARFDLWIERFYSVIKFAIGQWRMPREPIAGIAHIMIFSGFMVVSIATITHFVHAYSPTWIFPGLGGKLGLIYSMVKDIFEFLVLFGCSYGLWRRLKKTPSRVGRSQEGVFVLCMIIALMITDFIYYAKPFVAGIRNDFLWNPGAALVSLFLKPFGISIAENISNVSYWVHCVLVLVFLNFLPTGKHFHVITGIPKVFFRDLQPYGLIKKDDLENTESFGIRDTSDLTWSMVLDLYSCTECGRCSVYCPTVLTQKPLEHRKLNLTLKDALYEDRKTLLSGDKKEIEGLAALMGGKIDPETIWACTTCGSCEEECPVFIENIPRIIEMRKQKVLMEGDIAPELARAYKGMEQNNNPWGIGSDKRDEWAKDFDITRIADLEGADKENPPLLYWIGCAGSFDDRNKKITWAMVKILKTAKIPFVILGKEEGCTGDPARRTGNEYLFQILATQNVELLNEYGVKNILTHCPHCLHTIKTDYPQFGGKYEVVHHTQLIEKLIQENKLNFSDNAEKNDIAWHDSCYLGRYHNIYDAPRNVLNAIPGTHVVELERNKSRSVCCGAGGGRFWVEETIGTRINVHRAEEIVEANTSQVGSSCPFCLIMVRDGIADLNKDADISSQDIAEIVANSIITL